MIITRICLSVSIFLFFTSPAVTGYLNNYKGSEETGNSDFFARLLYEDSISLYSQRILMESSKTRSATVGGTIISRILLTSDHKYFLMLSLKKQVIFLSGADTNRRSPLRKLISSATGTSDFASFYYVIDSREYLSVDRVLLLKQRPVC